MGGERSVARIISLADVRGEREDFGRSPSQITQSQFTPTKQLPTEELYLHSILLDRIAFLEKEVTAMRQILQDFVASSDVIELRDVSYEEAKQEVALYFREHDGNEIGYEELVEELRLDPKLVVRICNELLEEGKIG